VSFLKHINFCINKRYEERRFVKKQRFMSIVKFERNQLNRQDVLGVYFSTRGAKWKNRKYHFHLGFRVWWEL